MSNIISISYPKTDANPSGLPLPKQKQFHNSGAKYRLLAGGFGTGKTTTLVMEVLYQLLNYAGNYGVLGRKDLGELKSTTLKELLDICPKQLIAEHNKQEKTIKLINGSELYYMNLDDSREATEKIKSLNLGFVAIDQLEEIQESVFYAFQGRLRRQSTARCFFATCNPAGHDWIYRRFKTKEDVKLQHQDNYDLFESITTDNVYLPKDYIEQLLQYPKNWVNRYVFCSWDDFEGIVYNEFKEQVHTISYYEPHFNMQHYIIIDYGYRNPTAVLFAETDYDSNTYIYNEFYQSGMLIKDIAEEIKKDKYHSNATILIDPSTFNTQRDGKSVADEFIENGIFVLPANNDVRQGIDRVNTLFKLNRLFIAKVCYFGLKEIGDYKYKTIKAGQARNEYEEPIKKDDHFCDALRYLVNHIYTPIQVPEDTTPDWFKGAIRKNKLKYSNKISVMGV